jgi:Protein of unknown function (DUF2971)
MSLCNDEIYFSHPGAFNDPLDCSPTLACDSTNEDLKKLLSFFIVRRVASQVVSHLTRAKISSANAAEHAQKQAANESQRQLANISYNATNPDYEGSIPENESWLLLCAIETELHRWYERGVCCFSESYSSPLLWSHYGDQHKGLCLGYTTNRNPTPKMQKVAYGGNRAIATSVLCSAFLLENTAAIESVDRDVLLRKATGWKYEGEWRLIGQQGLSSSPLFLTEVIFGLRCPPSVMYSVVKSLDGRENDVRFYEMTQVRSSFELRKRSVDVEELLIAFPITAKSGNEMFPS